MLPRQLALLQFHMDTARLLTGPDEVFWVLDLEDPVAFTIATSIQGEDEAAASARLSEARDALKSSAYPAATHLIGMESSARAFKLGWNIIEPLPAGKRYMAVVSSGKLFVAVVDAFGEKPKPTQQIERNPHGLS